MRPWITVTLLALFCSTLGVAQTQYLDNDQDTAYKKVFDTMLRFGDITKKTISMKKLDLLIKLDEDDFQRFKDWAEDYFLLNGREAYIDRGETTLGFVLFDNPNVVYTYYNKDKNVEKHLIETPDEDAVDDITLATEKQEDLGNIFLTHKLQLGLSCGSFSFHNFFNNKKNLLLAKN